LDSVPRRPGTYSSALLVSPNVECMINCVAPGL